MKVWVDCTAAAHPLVLRPIIERLEARGTRSSSPPASTGRRSASSTGSGCTTTVVGEHGGASQMGKGRAVEKRSRALAKLVWAKRPELALAHGSVDLAVVSWTLRLPSVQMQDYEFAKLQRQIAFRAAHRVLAPDAIPVDRLRKLGAKPKKLVRYPGLKEEYYLADFVPDQGIIDDLGLDRNKVIIGRPAAARDLRVPRPQRPLRRHRAPAGRGRRRGAGGDHPADRRAGRGGARPRRPQPADPRAGDRRPEPDRLRRPRGQRGGDDEPRGGRPRHPRLHHLQRPDGRGRRGADPRRPAAGAGATRPSCRCASGPIRSASSIRAIPSSSSRPCSAPSRVYA